MMEHADRHTDAPHAAGRGADALLKRRLLVSTGLTCVVLAAELAGGYFFNSLALMSDAAHVFMDALTLFLSWFALHISEMPPTEKRTFGLHRVEVFVSFINSLSLILITIFIFYMAYGRLSLPEPVDSVGTFIVAAVGLTANLVVAMWLMRYTASDLNVKSAFLHVIGDAAASVGVIIAAVIIYYTGWYLADPLISVLIGLIIVFGAYGIMRDSSHILLEGVPKGIELSRVAADIKAVEGVMGMHSIHIWSICHNVYALSAHIDIEPMQRRRMAEIFEAVNERLAQSHHIFYTTLQAECSGCDNGDMLRRLTHRERGHLH
ncbi:MAG: cation transporter [Deltaproteobacteria bacterium]|nr:cation transporter [Deltaproteobacteria bacterium]